MINDVSTAFLEAPARREVCIEFAEEESEVTDYGGEYVGCLEKNPYGTRDAAAHFQHEINVVMARAGVKRGKYNASAYYHASEQFGTNCACR